MYKNLPRFNVNQCSTVGGKIKVTHLYMSLAISFCDQLNEFLLLTFISCLFHKHGIFFFDIWNEVQNRS